MCSQTSVDFVGCCSFSCNKCESERVKSKPLRLSLPYLVWVLPVSPPRKASKKKNNGLNFHSVWPISPIRSSNSSDLCGDLSQSIRSRQRNRGLAPDLTYSPFINMCPCELILIARARLSTRISTMFVAGWFSVCIGQKQHSCSGDICCIPAGVITEPDVSQQLEGKPTKSFHSGELSTVGGTTFCPAEMHQVFRSM